MFILNKFIYNKMVIAVFIIIGLLIAGQIIAPGFADLPNIMNILKISSFLAVIALGQTFVVISGNEGVDLSVGGIISLSAVVASQIMNGENSNILSALVVVLLVGMILGAINGLGVSFLKIPPIIMTLSMGSVMQGIMLIYTGGQPKGRAADNIIALSAETTLGIPNVFIFMFIVGCIVVFLMKNTKWGYFLYGMGSNNLTAQLSGINTKVSRVIPYALSGMTSALGGVLLLGYISTAFLDMGSPYLMPSVAAIVIGGVSLSGGKGSYIGSSLGAILLTTLSSILVILKMNEAGRQIVFGIILLTLLILYTREK